jgi:hypothetical protein
MYNGDRISSPTPNADEEKSDRERKTLLLDLAKHDCHAFISLQDTKQDQTTQSFQPLPVGSQDAFVEQDQSDSSKNSENESFLGGSEYSDNSFLAPAQRLSTYSNISFSPTLRDFGLEVIRLLNLKLRVLFEDESIFVSHGGPSSSSTGSRKKRPEGGCEPDEQANSNGKRRIGPNDSRPVDKGRDDDPEEKQQAVGTLISRRELCANLACPFFKNNPEKYGVQKSCLGPGWLSVHRVKYVFQLPIRLGIDFSKLYIPLIWVIVIIC